MAETAERFILRVDGEPFRCPCGCNVFHKPDADELPGVYECNCCEAWYEGDAAE